jgi:hypothetical membrane protein
MNASFIIEGVLIGAGAVLMRRSLPAERAITIALLLFVIAAVGGVMAGLAPNDVNLPVHYSGAVLILFGGGLGMTLIGGTMLARRSAPMALALYTVASGIVAFAGTSLLAGGVTLGIGVGGIERVGFYPFPIWLTAIGLYYLFGSRAAGGALASVEPV